MHDGQRLIGVIVLHLATVLAAVVDVHARDLQVAALKGDPSVSADDLVAGREHAVALLPHDGQLPQVEHAAGQLHRVADLDPHQTALGGDSRHFRLVWKKGMRNE